MRILGIDPGSRTTGYGVIEADGLTPIAYGSVGPRAILVEDADGILADPRAPDERKAAVLDEMFAGASPSPRSMRASPDYRRAMLRVLGARALATAIERLGGGSE